MQQKSWAIVALVLIGAGAAFVVHHGNQKAMERPVHAFQGNLVDAPWVRTLAGAAIAVGVGMLFGLSVLSTGRQAAAVAAVPVLVAIMVTQVAHFKAIAAISELAYAYGGITVTAGLGLLGIGATWVAAQQSK